MESQGTFGVVANALARPMHVPFYCFAGRLSIAFTGLLGCEQADGGVKWYERNNLSFSVSTACAGRAMFVNARPDSQSSTLIDECLSNTLNEQVLDVDASWSPSKPYGIDAFRITPETAASELSGGQLSSRLASIATCEACRWLDSPRGRSLVYQPHGSPSEMRSGEFDELRPDGTVESNGRLLTRAEDIRWRLDNLRLHERGVVLIPVWTIDYYWNDEPCLAFVSGHDAKVAGVAHAPASASILAPQAAARGGRFGALGGLGLAIALARPLLLVPAPIGGAILGSALDLLASYLLVRIRMRVTVEKMINVHPHGRRERSSVQADHLERDYGEIAYGFAAADEEQSCKEQSTYWQCEVERVLGQAARRYAVQAAAEEEAREAAATALPWRQLNDYQLLGLPRALATELSIREAFRAQAMAWHPDRHQARSPAELAECTSRFQAIQRAHARLRHGHRRSG